MRLRFDDDSPDASVNRTRSVFSRDTCCPLRIIPNSYENGVGEFNEKDMLVDSWHFDVVTSSKPPFSRSEGYWITLDWKSVKSS